MNIVDDKCQRLIRENIFTELYSGQYQKASEEIFKILELLYQNIPDNKRISYGSTYVMRILTKHIAENYSSVNKSTDTLARQLFNQSAHYKVKGIALGLIALEDQGNMQEKFSYFRTASASEAWELREFAQMWFKKLIRKEPAKAKQFLLKQTKSSNPCIRRFVAETLRPVKENKWFFNNIDYSLDVLEKLFYESKPYPRTSVGNNLSDISKKKPELIFDIAAQLVKSGDKNAVWIAHRACRNLVKKKKDRVLEILNIREYKYKNKTYR